MVGSLLEMIYIQRKGQGNRQTITRGIYHTLSIEFNQMDDADHKMMKEDGDNKRTVKYLDSCLKSQQKLGSL